MNAYADVEARVAAALEALKKEGVLPSDIAVPPVEIETPRDPAHGDLACNAAMVLAKPASMKPRDIAVALQSKLAGGSGHRQRRGGRARLPQSQDDARVLARASSAPSSMKERSTAAPTSASRERTNVEYVSANPTGPMHVGHCRGAVFGDALANLLAFAGYDVTREYYINDAGGQVDVLARSAFLRYREALGEDIGAIPEGLYPGDYLKPVGEALAKEHGKALLDMPEERWLPLVRADAIAAMLVMIKDDLAASTFATTSSSPSGR